MLNALQNPPICLQEKTLYVACSGGRDSLSILYALHKVDYKVCALHAHHGLSDQADAWASLVVDFCKHHDIPCQVFALHLPSSANENLARSKRYDAFFSVMDTGDVLVLGHHAHDQAETFLMRALSGSGVFGLGGMLAWSSRMHSNKCIYLWRPWLKIARDSISHFAKIHSLPYVDDPTNLGGSNVRARLRRDVFAPLLDLFPTGIASLSATTRNLQDAAEVLNAVLDGALSKAVHMILPHMPSLDLDVLDVPNDAFLRLILHAYLERLGLGRTLNNALILRLQSLILNNQGTLVVKAGSFVCYRRRVIFVPEGWRYALLSIPSAIELLPFEVYQGPAMKLANKTAFDITLVPAQGHALHFLGKTHHQMFKKWAQSTAIPTFLRPLARLVLINEAPCALVWHYGALWLQGALGLDGFNMQEPVPWGYEF